MSVQSVLQTHRSDIDDLVVFADGSGSWVDIQFVFSGDPTRCITIRLLFVKPSMDPAAAETMYRMIGPEIAAQLSIQVLSFYDRRIEEQPESASPFAKPEGQFDLLLHELHYLYATIVDVIFKVVHSEKIEMLFFGADTQQLKKVYDRYLSKFAVKMGCSYHCEGAYYAIRTQYYPG